MQDQNKFILNRDAAELDHLIERMEKQEMLLKNFKGLENENK